MKSFLTPILLLITFITYAQPGEIRGQLQDSEGAVVEFANVALYHQADSSLAKAEVSNESGVFHIKGINPGNYFLKATYVGAADLVKKGLEVSQGQILDLGVLAFQSTSIELAEATVTATRAMVEVKPDRMVFNVQGTINSTGSDGLSLLRKAPGVTIDNNDNISVLGRSGVLLYVDGKRLPLTGQDLSQYLQNLPAEQIDRIDIITNPGARYEAEGNAGIIDIRLKKDEGLGGNGSVSTTYTQGRYARMNANASGNYRNKFLNAFGSVGTGQGDNFNNMTFQSFLNDLILDEYNRGRNNWQFYNYRLGMDFYLADKHTIGFLIDGRKMNGERRGVNRIDIYQQATPEVVDSFLIADSFSDNARSQNTFNINYRFDNKKGQTLNVDLDYGRYENDSERYQPNRYYDAGEEIPKLVIINSFDTPTDIDIYTFKLDYEAELFGGKFSTGTKLSRVISDNTFLFYDVIDDQNFLNDSLSNRFEYDENVYAGYLNFARPIGDNWNFSAGLRAEATDATGDLKAFLPQLQEPPVIFDYLSWFPSIGLTWQVTPQNTLALNYGRRINRPDYNVLNPFENRLSQLSYEKGNPFLLPEIVNNFEIGYTVKYLYNFKLAYSRTTDQITRLIGPDEFDPRSTFITWDNLEDQTVFSFNFSAPVQILEKWNAYFNVSASHLNNQADYGDGAVVDVQAFTYSIFQQHTIDLPAGFKGEVSGYYSGPGIWGGVFEYESNWSLNLGLQRKFIDNKLNVRLTVNDIFYETGWDGVSIFDGLESAGGGRWDSRFASLNLNYQFGNEKVKSRKRKTGLQEEADRVGDGN